MTMNMDVRKFGRVAVVMGGDSSEREISLKSGQAVYAALQQAGVDVMAVDGLQALRLAIENDGIDRVFNILHGRGGEDGVLQGMLRSLNVPVTGSGVLGSALSMDKFRSKQIWQQGDIATPRFAVATENNVDDLANKMGFPLVLKPSREGSSVGVHIVHDQTALRSALADAAQYDTVMLEQFVRGDEYTVGFIGASTLPPIKVEVPDGFYDYNAKYLSDTTRYICPTELAQSELQMLSDLTLKAAAAVAVSGWGRADFIRAEDGCFYLLEINTTPGMTTTSLVPKAAQQAGLSFAQLVLRILETSL